MTAAQIAPSTATQVAAYQAELARWGLTAHDLDPSTKHKLVRVRVVGPTPTFEQAAAPTNWGTAYADIRPGMAPGTRRTRIS